MLFLPGYFSKAFSTEVSVDGKRHVPCEHRVNKHAQSKCGKDACPHLPQAAVLLAYKEATEESLLSSIHTVISSQLPALVVCQL